MTKYFYSNIHIIIILLVIIFSPINLCHASFFYIDYSQGNDDNPGTKLAPWKHHPWDLKATGNAIKCTGSNSYFFKKGTIYRGTLIAKDSGTAKEPIILTVDPDWGTGKALIYGSYRLTEQWQSCTPKECSEIPTGNLDTTWFTDIPDRILPQAVFNVKNEQVTRLDLARQPNWKISNPDDPRREWWEWTESSLELQVWVDNAKPFEVGDEVYFVKNRSIFSPSLASHEMSCRIAGKGQNWLRLIVPDAEIEKIKTGSQIGNNLHQATIKKISGSSDIKVLAKDDLHYPAQKNMLTGATVWSETGRNPIPLASIIEDFDPENKSLQFYFRRPLELLPLKFDRYFLENLPVFLDSPYEWYFSSKGEKGRLFINLPHGYSPNKNIFEASYLPKFFQTNGNNNITIDGIDFQFFNDLEANSKSKSRNAGCYNSVIQINGNSDNINIYNCSFSHTPYGISIFPNNDDQLIDNITISQNTFSNIGGFAINASNGLDHWLINDNTIFKPKRCRLRHISVLNNKINNCGFRNMTTNYACIDIHGGELVEIAGNRVNLAYGPGILAYNGSFFDDSGIQYPLIRTLIHENIVSNSILAGQDYGGISSWIAGPSYIYNNISDNPVGYKYSEGKKNYNSGSFRDSSFGIGIYLDQQYKSYVFNNLIVGINNNIHDTIYNSVGINEAQGFLNQIFNNTIYRFAIGIHKGMIEHNRCLYLNNLFIDIGYSFISQEVKPEWIEFTSLGFGNNVFYGHPEQFGTIGNSSFPSLGEWQNFLEEKNALLAETGKISSQLPTTSLNEQILMPTNNSGAIDRASKVFVPWGLYRVTGEWHFTENKNEPLIIFDEHVTFDEQWKNRYSVRENTPRNDLICAQQKHSHFVKGTLENWNPGALEFDGNSNFCMTKESNLLNMEDGNFLIETVLLVNKSMTAKTIVSKFDLHTGYSLQVNEKGKVRINLLDKDKIFFGESTIEIDDGKWHHIIAEVNRFIPKFIHIYIDGKDCSGMQEGNLSDLGNLSNDAPFRVGISSGQADFFDGALDFLRVSRGTLQDAKTSIEELYAWEFDGPFLRDFNGTAQTGTARDSGAIEWHQNN